MFRSADARTALVAVTFAASAVLGAAAPVLASASPSPAPRNQNPVANAPVVPINGPVLDILVRVGNADGSEIDQSGGNKHSITLAADVLFGFDSATLTSGAQARLSEIAARLRTQAQGKQLHIDGYTDAKGSDSYNQPLSQRRAEAVQTALSQLVSGAGITFAVTGHGSADPVAANANKDGSDNPAGRAKNRRVVISFSA